LREGLREIRDELRGLNVRLEAKASTWLVGAGIACPAPDGCNPG
jgi:hypothetical protein